MHPALKALSDDVHLNYCVGNLDEPCNAEQWLSVISYPGHEAEPLVPWEGVCYGLSAAFKGERNVAIQEASPWYNDEDTNAGIGSMFYALVAAMTAQVEVDPPLWMEIVTAPSYEDTASAFVLFRDQVLLRVESKPWNLWFAELDDFDTFMSDHTATLQRRYAEVSPLLPRRTGCPFPMTPEEYVAANTSGRFPAGCPNCGNDHQIEYQSMDFEMGLIAQRNDCHACGLKWADVYHLVRYDAVED